MFKVTDMTTGCLCAVVGSFNPKDADFRQRLGPNDILLGLATAGAVAARRRQLRQRVQRAGLASRPLSGAGLAGWLPSSRRLQSQLNACQQLLRLWRRRWPYLALWRGCASHSSARGAWSWARMVHTRRGHGSCPANSPQLG